MPRGYFGIGVVGAKTETNVGTLLRSAHAFGAAFVFTVGHRYGRRQSTDTTDATRHVPLWQFATFEELVRSVPLGCAMIGVELDERAVALSEFKHPERALYVLGAEDHGLSEADRSRCDALVQIPGAAFCLNVATAGSIVLYDRLCRSGGAL